MLAQTGYEIYCVGLRVIHFFHAHYVFSLPSSIPQFLQIKNLSHAVNILFKLYFLRKFFSLLEVVKEASYKNLWIRHRYLNSMVKYLSSWVNWSLECFPGRWRPGPKGSVCPWLRSNWYTYDAVTSGILEDYKGTQEPCLLPNENCL